MFLVWQTEEGLFQLQLWMAKTTTAWRCVYATLRKRNMSGYSAKCGTRRNAHGVSRQRSERAILLAEGRTSPCRVRPRSAQLGHAAVCWATHVCFV